MAENHITEAEDLEHDQLAMLLRRGERRRKDDSCSLCGNEWHGLENSFCPGPWGTQEQIAAFHARKAEVGKIT